MKGLSKPLYQGSIIGIVVFLTMIIPYYYQESEYLGLIFTVVFAIAGAVIMAFIYLFDRFDPFEDEQDILE